MKSSTVADITNTIQRIDAEHVRAARARATQLSRPLLEVLEELLGLSPEDFLTRLAFTFHYPPFTMTALDALAPAFDALSYTDCLRRSCIPLRSDSGAFYLVFSDPFLPDICAWVEERLGFPPHWGLAHRADVQAYLARHEEGLRAMDAILSTTVVAGPRAADVEDLSLRAIAEDSSPVVKLVHSTLYDALKSDASDVHLESGPAGLTIKYRIDGVLTQVSMAQGAELTEQVISRIKVMAELDIAERRVPQDGRLRVAMRGSEIDVRVSIIPSIHGEDAVLRILDKRALAQSIKGLNLDRLGFPDSDVVRLRRLAQAPYGMLLVTGPTGSGKTTTLYGMISEINTGQDKIVTIEDPVEYQLPGILQIPVNDKKGLTFARGLRSILRHDPDKIMVGEIRDAETAHIAVQAALTGHLVFTTVHANGVFDVLGRFIHMGVDPHSFVSSLNGILAQRLLRINCPHCTVNEAADQKLMAMSGLTTGSPDFVFRRGRGCGHCRGTGYKGRKAIAEILELNDELKEAVIAKAPLRLIKEAAHRAGMRDLRQAALELVRCGMTTLQEINRVTFAA
jgi:general secretion pathway protein E